MTIYLSRFSGLALKQYAIQKTWFTLAGVGTAPRPRMGTCSAAPRTRLGYCRMEALLHCEVCARADARWEVPSLAEHLDMLDALRVPLLNIVVPAK